MLSSTRLSFYTSITKGNEANEKTFSLPLLYSGFCLVVANRNSLVLASHGYIPISKELLSLIALPAVIIAAFGPAAGAFYSLYTLNGKGSIKKYLKSLLDFRFGW